MKCGTMLKPGEVILIPFPFSDLSAQKRRPALVCTQPDIYGDFLAVAITSQPGHQDAFEIMQTLGVQLYFLQQTDSDTTYCGSLSRIY